LVKALSRTGPSEEKKYEKEIIIMKAEDGLYKYILRVPESHP
jgi:hypothetical protein